MLPLKCFDMILGNDWLEDHSPMWVHWGKKLMKFTYGGKRVTLQGLSSDTVHCTPVKTQGLKGLLNRQAIIHCVQLRLDDVQGRGAVVIQSVAAVSDQQVEAMYDKKVESQMDQILDQFSDIFQTPSTLPPPRPFDHSILLLPGAQPINIRAYRYSPSQKDEIERQLTKML